MSKIGIVDSGGGMRGIYGAAVFDWCIDNNITFDFFVGVSAGSANICSFLAGQKGRNVRFYTKYSLRPQYMSFRNMLKTGNYLNLEYIYGDGLSNSTSEDPLDFNEIIRSGKPFKIVATDSKTGQPVYYDSTEMKLNDYGAVKGSSCVPIASRPYHWHGKYLYDGGISDPIPFEYALNNGCDKVIVILTRPKNKMRPLDSDAKAVRILRLIRPVAAKALAGRIKRYNHQLKTALELEKEGKLLIISPEDIGGMETLTKDPEQMKALYRTGRKDAEKILDFIA